MASTKMHHGGMAPKDLEGSAQHHEAFLDLPLNEEIVQRLTTNLPRVHISHPVYHIVDDLESTLKETEEQQARRERLRGERTMTVMSCPTRS